MVSGVATWPEIRAHLDRLRAAHAGRPQTNCFGPPGEEGLPLSLGAGALVFSRYERDFARTYYHAADAAELEGLLREHALPVPQVLGYLDRVRDEALCGRFRRAGYEETAHYLRMTHAAFPEPGTTVKPEFAEEGELAQVQGLIEGAFSAMTDHLPDAASLAGWIRDRRVLVRRTEGRVSGTLAFQLLGRQVNFNYFVNRGPRGDGSCLMDAFLRCMADRGIRSGFLWVNAANARALRIYEVCGWKRDGLNDWFHVRPAAAG